MTVVQASQALAVADAGWEARLELEFALRAGRTLLAARHQGPLTVQRPFYPEADATCHVYVLHPPGGVVGGDRLTLEARLGPGARALLTTPAATKLYRSAGRPAGQRQHFTLARGSRLEWLPQENIVYAGAEIRLETELELEDDAELVLWDITCLGRPAIGETLSSGYVLQRLALHRDGEPLLLERACYEAGSTSLQAAFALGGRPVVGVLACVSRRATADLVPDLRAAMREHAPGEVACTRLPGALVCRYLGFSTERAREAFTAAWRLLRSRCFGTEPVSPRIWAT